MSANMRYRPPIMVVAAILFLLAYAAAADASPQGNTTRVQVPAGWQVFRGQSGLVVLHPAGWPVKEYPGGGFLAMHHDESGLGDGFAMAQPLSPGDQIASAVQGLKEIMARRFPGIQVSRLRQLSTQPDVAEARLEYVAKGRPFQGAAMYFRLRQKAMLYVAATTRATWPGERGKALAILKGFWYAAPATKTATKSAPTDLKLPRMVPWRDPSEQAFSAQVPAGWTVQGGLRRFHAVDVRPELVAISPDGGVLVRLGDARIPPMVQANAMLASTGFPEGSMYSPGYGLQQLVLRYLPGARFATEYYLPSLLGKISQVQVRDLPEVARKVQAVYQQAGLSVQVDTGEVSFTSQDRQQGPRRGYVFAQTYKVETPGMPGMGTWYVEILYGYLAKPGEEPLARAVLNAMVQSFRIDPDWMARQAQTAGQVSGIVTRTNQQITSIIRDAFEYQQRVQEQALARYDRGAVRGSVLVEDPNTGERFEVPGGSNYYWRREGQDGFVGTQTADRPYSPNHWLERMNVLE